MTTTHDLAEALRKYLPAMGHSLNIANCRACEAYEQLKKGLDAYDAQQREGTPTPISQDEYDRAKEAWDARYDGVNFSMAMYCAITAAFAERDAKAVPVAWMVKWFATRLGDWRFSYHGRLEVARFAVQDLAAADPPMPAEIIPLYTAPPPSPQQAPSEGLESFQDRLRPWMLECFGEAISNDTVERNHRFLEESLELVQACGCTREDAHALVDYTFNRPVGEKSQEVGGVKVTLAALCLAQNIDMDAAGETELARIWTKMDVIRAKQAAKPRGPLAAHPSATRMSVSEADAWAAFVATLPEPVQRNIADVEKAGSPSITRDAFRYAFATTHSSGAGDEGKNAKR